VMQRRYLDYFASIAQGTPLFGDSS
jgi:hypothetical protein